MTVKYLKIKICAIYYDEQIRVSTRYVFNGIKNVISKNIAHTFTWISSPTTNQIVEN